MPRKPSPKRRVTTRKKGVELRFYAPWARRVCVAGDFNNWNTDALEMQSNGQGEWLLKLKLAPGKYEYKFFADGVWHNDPEASQQLPNVWGSENSMLQVSA